uniref:Uncharacterized protein n=1 Tax=Anguilla anguilla TaxID=7936 RepID=A0A0E9QTV9_ANGAN
MCLKLSDL